MKELLFVFSFFLLLASCKDKQKQNINAGEQLAKNYCGSCHLYPEPGLLDKTTWREAVLPSMAFMMGIDAVYEMPLDNFKSPVISIEDWKKIASFYFNQAPDSMAGQGREPIHEFTDLFLTRQVTISEGKLPSASYIKIDSANHWIFVANAFDSSLHIYDQELKLVASNNMHSTIVNIQFANSILKTGNRSGIVTNIGIMNPNDQQTGSLDTFNINEKGKLIYSSRLFDTMPRPVEISGCDLNNDGLRDYLVCGFGNKAGALYWMKGVKGHAYQKQIIRPLPGAIKSYIDDVNHDRLPDIITLMSQADEGIFLFQNKGNGIFETKTLLRFPPVYGSSYFEMKDFNGDGFKDIIYTCGDNADYSYKVLKNFHGLYIFLNDGHNNFIKKYFFPVHGAFKAMASDFDKDGDLDIAMISYFPDEKLQPQESFVYLQQNKNFQFTPFTIKEFDAGRWLTMDVGDLDADGDDDIVLGSLVPPVSAQEEKWKNNSSQKAEFLLLENKTRK